MNKHISPPKFTHKLSFDEQRTLSPEQAIAYCDWIMSLPIRTKVGVTEEELLDRDYQMADANYTKAEIGG